MQLIYFDCFSGVSGDMILGAFLDLGLPPKRLKETLKALPLPELRLRIRREERSHISGVALEVRGNPPKGRIRTYASIRDMLLESPLEEEIKKNALEILTRLAKTEGKIHDTPLEEVHFHEIGALDTIVDIVGTALAFHYFRIEEVHSSPLPVGRGWITSGHGRLPLPAPAALSLLEGAEVVPSGTTEELVTPTGAAILTHYARRYGPPPAMTLKGVGYGLGQKRLEDRPNALRLWLGEKRREAQTERLIVLETNIDDMNPQWYDRLWERLFAAGALDGLMIPCQMKKNRPGVLLQVLTDPEHRQVLQDIILAETTTLGVRSCEVDRYALPRTIETVDTPWGPVRIKRVLRPGLEKDEGRKDFSLEYEDLKKAADRSGRSLKEMEGLLRGFMENQGVFRKK
jgi:uncharacterized protein (TIGR00299 family) protein